jgi:hypothetical protein
MGQFAAIAALSPSSIASLPSACGSRHVETLADPCDSKREAAGPQRREPTAKRDS